MSDLQCPATVLLISSECVASDGCRRALEGQRLFGFYVDVGIEEGAAVSGLARAAGCSVQRIGVLQNGAGLRQALEDLADVHRGETIAVVATAKLIQSRLALERTPSLPIEVKIDSSGWVVSAPSAPR